MMNKDTIYRQDAIDALIAEGRNVDSRYLESERIIHESDAVEAISMLPSARPERKKGWWVKMSDRDGVYWACSECGEDIPRISHFDPQFDLFPRLESIDKTNCCPNCGCPMEDKT